MPGIITHNRIIIESINYLKKKKNVYPSTKSVETLFASSNLKRAALFGSIGPNIFDYIPTRRKSPFGSDISYFIHDGGNYKVLSSMLKRLFKLRDHNNEWASIQRAYLYGFISHIVSDSVFHPFIFYWSGFPENHRGDRINHYREQNLLFEYNMDIYFQYYYNNTDYVFNLENMLPVQKRRWHSTIDKAIKEFIIGSILDSYPEIMKKIILKKGKKGDSFLSNSFGYIDLVPYFIKLTYFMKKNRNRYFIKLIDSIKRNKIFYSDFIVRYPEPRRINKHVLNLHRERWFYPAGAPGLHYESVEDLMKISCDTIVDIWERIESMINSNTINFNEILSTLNINLLTGEKKKKHNDMRLMNPIRLRF